MIFYKKILVFYVKMWVSVSKCVKILIFQGPNWSKFGFPSQNVGSKVKICQFWFFLGQNFGFRSTFVKFLVSQGSNLSNLWFFLGQNCGFLGFYCYIFHLIGI